MRCHPGQCKVKSCWCRLFYLLIALCITATAYCLLFLTYGKKIFRNNTLGFRRYRADCCRCELYKWRKRWSTYQGDSCLWHLRYPVLYCGRKPYSNYKGQTVLATRCGYLVTSRTATSDPQSEAFHRSIWAAYRKWLIGLKYFLC